MEAALYTIGHWVALGVEAIAIVIIATGSVEAVASIARIIRTPRVTGVERRGVWLDFAAWLVAALTFQLAADTSFSPTWDDVGRLGAIAAIRTFLSYFLDREVESTRRLQHVGGTDANGGRAMLRDVRPQEG
jgi:uncharacterized membrane protein